MQVAHCTERTVISIIFFPFWSQLKCCTYVSKENKYWLGVIFSSSLLLSITGSSSLLVPLHSLSLFLPCSSSSLLSLPCSFFFLAPPPHCSPSCFSFFLFFAPLPSSLFPEISLFLPCLITTLNSFFRSV